MQHLREIDIHKLLAERKQIAVIWSIEDVQEVRPDLDEEECWQVLELVSYRHDANDGISWLTLELAAQSLFDAAPETDNAVEA